MPWSNAHISGTKSHINPANKFPGAPSSYCRKVPDPKAMSEMMILAKSKAEYDISGGSRTLPGDS